MATVEETQQSCRPKYVIQDWITSDRNNDASFRVRRYGKAFYIDVSPSQFINSPLTKEKYLSYLEVLRSGEEVIGDIFDTDVLDWAVRPFEPLFVELAPSPVQPDSQAEITVTLKEYLYPTFFLFSLDVVDEKLQPRRIETEKSPYNGGGAWLYDDVLDDLETWSAFYDPARVVLSFDDPEDALFKPPRRVLIDDGQTSCFYKSCFSPVQTKTEMEAYKKITAANIGPHLNLCRFFGAVMDDNNAILGLLLTHIDNDGKTLAMDVDPWYPSASTRQRWVEQLESTLAELHKAGIVWGDVKAENVLVDREDNLWIIDFGGGYTEGWVERDMAGTIEGDLAGMAKLKEFIFQDEAWWAERMRARGLTDLSSSTPQR